MATGIAALNVMDGGWRPQGQAVGRSAEMRAHGPSRHDVDLSKDCVGLGILASTTLRQPLCCHHSTLSAYLGYRSDKGASEELEGRFPCACMYEGGKSAKGRYPLSKLSVAHQLTLCLVRVVRHSALRGVGGKQRQGLIT